MYGSLTLSDFACLNFIWQILAERDKLVFLIWTPLFLVPLSQLLWQQRCNNLPSKWHFASRISKTQFFSCIPFLQAWTINRKIIKKFCNAIFFQKLKITVSSITFFGITEFFYNLSIDCSCLKKKYARKKKRGSPCLFLKYAKQKANLKAICCLCCHSN